MQKRLLGAAQALADATYRMVEAAKVKIIPNIYCNKCSELSSCLHLNIEGTSFKSQSLEHEICYYQDACCIF